MIKKAKYIDDYKIEIVFSDNTIRNIDLKDFLFKSQDPYVKKYINKKLFKQFRIKNGDICWGDNEFDLNPFNICNGKFDYNLNVTSHKHK